MCITREKFHLKGENFPNVDKQNNIKNVEYEEANLHSFFIKDLEKAKKENIKVMSLGIFNKMIMS